MAIVRNKVNILTKYGDCTFVSFHHLDSLYEHFALIFKDATSLKNPLVRVHSECITGDLFGSCKCDCGDQLNEALKTFSEKGGILLYLRQEGRGIGIYNKLDAYSLQEQGFDTFQANMLLNFPADKRKYDVAANMLKALGILNIDLLTNNPDKVQQIRENGINIRERISTKFYLKKDNKKYLQTKIEKADHLFLNNIITIQASK